MYLAVLGMEPRALFLLGKHSPLSYTPALILGFKQRWLRWESAYQPRPEKQKEVLRFSDARSLFYFILFIHLFIHYCFAGVHYDIYNIIYLNSPPPPFSFIPLLHSWNSFNRSHFSIYIHVHTVFAPYSPSYTLSPHPSPSHCYPSSPQQDLVCPPVLRFCKKKKCFFV
jgi:hypothetical protein